MLLLFLDLSVLAFRVFLTVLFILGQMATPPTHGSRLESATVSAQQLQSLADDLVLRAIVKGSNDNVTVLIVLLHPVLK